MRHAWLAAALVAAAACSPAGAATTIHSDAKLTNTVHARPDDAQSDPSGTHKWTPAEIAAEGTPYCTAHFCVHWTPVGADGSSQSYAQQMGDILENEVYPCENGTAPTACAGSPGLGWRDAQSDFGTGGSDATDVYIEDLYATLRVYGYTATDPGQDTNPNTPHYAYMVMDRDYSRYAAGSTAGGAAAERVTAAHEYNHVLQNAYDFLQDPWMFEATATYMEDKVYPDNNDYVNYVKSWVGQTKEPLTAFRSGDLKPYGSAVWNHWLDHRFGPGVVRAAWEQSTAVGSFAPAAYDSAISLFGGSGFSDEFDRFSAAVAEWNAPGSGFPDHYPDVPRDGSLAVGQQTSAFALPHTTFEFFDVPVPADAPRTVRLIGTLPAGTAGAVELVGRTGPDPNGGTVTSNLTPMPDGGTAGVQLDNPAQFGRITAVVVNSDFLRSGFDLQANDYVFAHDAGAVTASLSEPGPPTAATGAAGLISDHAAFVNATVDPHLNDTHWSIEYGRSVGYGARSAPQTVPGSAVTAPVVSAPLPGLRANTVYHYRVTATNSAGDTAGRDLTFRTAHDVTPPVLSVKAKRQRLRGARTRGVVYLLRCSERCRGTATVTVSRAVARRLGLATVLGRSHVALDARTKSKALRVRLSPRSRRVLAHERRTLRVELVLALADDARNRARATRALALSR